MKKRSSSSSLGPISPISLGDFSQKAMHTYGTFVLLDRAVADVRDGLKPVQRRILWAMHALKKQGGGFKKSAKVVGDTMGNYHPHGDQAIYAAMVNMTWDRYPLIEGHGNFGSSTDNPAASRYTEARLTPLAEELFKDIDVATFVPNYSGDKEEPLVLPSRIPLVLLNGSSGIGVALRASIPPHNLRELLKVLIYYITKENPNLDTVLKHMPGPDYGYGVLLSSPEEVKALYETGAGSLQFRCEYEFETGGKNGSALVVKSLAPGFNMSNFLTKMRKLSDEGLIEFCSDSTNSKGICIYVGFKDATVIKERVLPELHRTESYQFYVVKRNTDENSQVGEDNLFSGGLFRLFQEFLDFRRVVETARLQREWKLHKALLLKAKAILAAIQNLEKVCEVLLETGPDLDLRKRMAEVLEVSENQAQIILDMKVQQLHRLNEQSQYDKIDEIRSTLETIKSDLENVDAVIVRHLKELLPFTDERKMRLETGTSGPKLSVKESEKYIISQGMKVSRQDKEPSRRHKFELVAKGTSSVIVVLSNNEAKTLSLSFLTEDSFSHVPVGLIGDSATVLAAVDQHGKVVLVVPPSRPTFNVMRGADSLVSAVGIVPGGYLALVSPSGRGRLLPVDSLETSRAFVRGKKMFPTDAFGSPKDRVSILYSLPPGAELFDAKGQCLTCDGEEYFEGKQRLFAIGKQNFVLVKDERRDIVNKDDAVSLLKNGELKECWIL